MLDLHSNSGGICISDGGSCIPLLLLLLLLPAMLLLLLGGPVLEVLLLELVLRLRVSSPRR